MGGSAFLVHGTVSETRLAAVAPPRSFLDRWLQRAPKPALRETDLGKYRLVDVQCRELDVLFQDFLGFVHERMSEPWPATRFIFDYLMMRGVFTIYLRGEAQGHAAPSEYYLQFTFSGCAGEAQVTSELATHWAQIWYGASEERLAADYLVPFGFQPRPAAREENERYVFIPVGDAGYARFLGSVSPGDGGMTSGQLFDVDPSLEQGLDLAAFSREFGPLMSDGTCRCQLCSPEYRAT